jgi:hypothetical protein
MHYSPFRDEVLGILGHVSTDLLIYLATQGVVTLGHNNDSSEGVHLPGCLRHLIAAAPWAT